MRVKIHRGSEQVGGTCVELESQGKRILLDLGMPLDAEDGEIPMPDVPGITGGDPSLLGVVISHLHGDHCGLVPYAAPGLPLAMGPVAARILRRGRVLHRASTVAGADVAAPRPEDVRDRAVQDHALPHGAQRVRCLRAPGRGRRAAPVLHGGLPRPRERPGAVRAAPGGSSARRPRADDGGDPDRGRPVGRRAERGGPARGRWRAEFKEWPGLVLVAWSSQNLDRLRTVYEAAREAGRVLAVDLYTADLARAAKAPGVPAPGSPGLEVYCRRRERIQVKEAREFHRTNSVYPIRIFPRRLAPRASQARADAAAVDGARARAGGGPAGGAGRVVDVEGVPGWGVREDG